MVSLGLPETVVPWISFTFILLASLVAGWIVKRLSHRFIFRILTQLNVDFEPDYYNTFSRFIIPWSVCLGLAIGKFSLPISGDWMVRLNQALLSIVLFTSGLVLSDFLIIFIREKSKTAVEHPMTSFTANAVRIIVLTVAFLMIFSVYNIAIAPLLTALGVGSLAVALGLHDTLSNFFAGIYIVKSRIVKIDDYIKLDSGQEGFVVDIGLTTVQMRTLSNNLIYVPTSKMSQSIVTNYSHPLPDFWVNVELRIGYDSNLDRVEKITLETAKTVMAGHGITDAEPTVRFHNFGDAGPQFTVSLNTKEINQKAALVHEFMKAIHRRFEQDGIRISLPQQVVYLEPSANKS